MANDNVKAIVANNGFEYEVEFKKIVNYKKCCDRGCIAINIKIRKDQSGQFEGFSKKNEKSGEKFKDFTYGEFCPLCGTSFGINRRMRACQNIPEWRKALEDIDVAARKAWLSLRE